MTTHAQTKTPGAKRGRPLFTDTKRLKSRTMTVCLTPETHKKLLKLAHKNNQKPAAMGRILIESGMSATAQVE